MIVKWQPLAIKLATDFVRRQGRWKYDLEDVISVAYIALCYAAERYDKRKCDQFAPWAIMVIKHYLTMHGKKQSKQYRGHKVINIQPEWSNLIESPNHEPEADETFVRLKKELSRREYSLLVRRFADDMSLEEIANQEGVTRQAIALRIERVFRKIRNTMEDPRD